MNKEMLAAWQHADDEYIRDLMNRREEMMRCANLFTDRINTTIDSSKAIERSGSYVAPAKPGNEIKTDDGFEREPQTSQEMNEQIDRVSGISQFVLGDPQAQREQLEQQEAA